MLIPVCGQTAVGAAHKGAGSGSRHRPLHCLLAVQNEGAWDPQRRTHGRVILLLQSRRTCVDHEVSVHCVVVVSAR